MKGNRLAIFNRFKTGNGDLTGEAKRQRSIISALAGGASPADRTRTGIAQKIASAEDTIWKNIYSGIFKDLDGVLIPMNIVREEGRLPLKRGPKALQKAGVPYYSLTKDGIIVAASLADPGEVGRLLGAFAKDAETDREKESAMTLGAISDSSPALVSYVMRRYAEAFCDGAMAGLLPFDLARLQDVPDEFLAVQRETIAAFSKMTEPEQGAIMQVLDEMTGGTKSE